MWTVRGQQLAEAGIFLDGPIAPPDLSITYDENNPDYHEIDLDRVDECYLKGRGNFWIAWLDGQPVGYVGAQDCSEHIELRRMYVRQDVRRQGIGSALVQSLIAHCRVKAVDRIKLWTGLDGNGRFLYAALGFRQIAIPESEASHPAALGGEIRMLWIPN